MNLIPGREMCDCGHIESDHSSITRGYGTDRVTGKTACYNCCVKNDLKRLKDTKYLSAYVSCDKKYVTTWPGNILATITGGHTVNFGFRKNQYSFNAVLEDGTKVVGYGPGAGVFCRIRLIKQEK